MPDPGDEVAVLCTVAVSVLAEEAGLPDGVLIFPGREIIVPCGDSARIAVDAGGLANARIAAISADGEGLFSFDGGVVTDIAVTLRSVSANTEVLVELAKIDALLPAAEILWPALAAPDGSFARLPRCVAGTLGYRLNKRMASGVIKWREVTDPYYVDADSLRTVKIPDDLADSAHLVGDLAYASPLGYLDAGVQKFDFAVSPKAGKRVGEGVFCENCVYAFEVQFTDSLGNRSAPASRMAVSGSEDADSCAFAQYDWRKLK
jgi:hypothetical protein